MWGKIDRSARSFNRIKRMAERALLVMEYAHENPKVVVLNEKSDVKWSDFTASQFVVNLINKSGKPVSENLLLKRMRENKVFTPYALITRLMTELIGEGVIKSVKGKGYTLSDEMKELVDEQKGVDFKPVPAGEKKVFDPATEEAQELKVYALYPKPNGDWHVENQIVNLLYRNQETHWSQSSIDDYIFANGIGVGLDRLVDLGVIERVRDQIVRYKLTAAFLVFVRTADEEV